MAVRIASDAAYRDRLRERVRAAAPAVFESAAAVDQLEAFFAEAIARAAAV